MLIITFIMILSEILNIFDIPFYAYIISGVFLLVEFRLIQTLMVMFLKGIGTHLDMEFMKFFDNYLDKRYGNKLNIKVKLEEENK
ncbi:MAG: hypothetical protein LBM93_14680 [Oscillospiraceae bacterium]|nr:hypothetical protein [Oscillospiraceae bacterium]